MKKQLSIYLSLCITALLLTTTSCSREDVAPVLSEAASSATHTSFDLTAEKLTDIMVLARDNDWSSQGDLLMRLLQPERPLSQSEIAAAEAELGISHTELDRMVTELGLAAQDYTNSIMRLNLSDEDRAELIRRDLASSALQNFIRSGMVDEQGRCLLRDLCFVIGYFLVDVWLELTCDFFCEEEALPYQILVNEICGLINC